MKPVNNDKSFVAPEPVVKTANRLSLRAWLCKRLCGKLEAAPPTPPIQNPSIVHACIRLGADGQENSPPNKKGWKVAAGCEAGLRHVSHGRGCDDAVGSFVAGKLLAVAMADGAGSAPRGGLGATLAVRAAIAGMQHAYLTGESITFESAPAILQSAFRCAKKSLADEAIRLSASPRDLASTLIAVVTDGTFVATSQVGDGAVVIHDESSGLLTLSAPTNGEFANETALLGCGSFVDVKVSMLKEAQVRDLAVFTDGLQRVALNLPAGAPHAGFFDPLFQGLGKLEAADAEKALTAFLNSAALVARTDDDKTLLVAQFIPQ